MPAWVGEILAILVVHLLRYFQQRQDLKASVRNELYVEAMNYANKARDWKLAALRDPAGHSELKVKNSDREIDI
jgi:hypothetical protein